MLPFFKRNMTPPERILSALSALYIYLSIYLSIHLSICLCIFLSIYLSTHLCMRQLLVAGRRAATIFKTIPHCRPGLGPKYTTPKFLS